MKIATRIFLLSLFAFSINGLFAQLSFTNQSALLGPSAGGTNDCAVDMNGDYLDDIVSVYTNQLVIDYQQEDGSFIEEVYPANFSSMPSWSICAGDIDNNGYNDLCFGDGSSCSFVYSNGNGSEYSEVTGSNSIFSQRNTFADIDNDGHLDAFVCHDVDQSLPFRNDGNGNLVLDHTLISTLDMPGNYAAIWTDYDNDGDIDLYMTKCKLGSVSGDPHRTNRLYRNNGDGSFDEVADEAGIDDNAQSWATVFEDFDNDGDFDAFIVNHDFKNRFYLNNGDGTFTDIIDDTGIDAFDLGAWENASGDFDNDGFVDIFSELNNSFYMNNGDLTFTPLNLPFDDGGIGDFNNDGFLDVINGTSLWINDGNDNNWLKVSLLGIVSNKNAIGARVEIHGDWGIQIREVRSGQTFSPMSTLNIHFGIGQSTEIDQIVVKWPSGIITTIPTPEINQSITIPESENGCILNTDDLVVTGETEICPGDISGILAPAGYNYLWSNGANSQSIFVDEPGNYSVILTDTAGCVGISNQVQIIFIEDNPPTVFVDGEEKFCEGNSTTLVATGGESPIWSNGMTGEIIDVFESGTYFATTDAICSEDQLESNEVTIEVLLAEEPVVEDDIVISGNSIMLEATGAGIMNWYDEEIGGMLLWTGNTFETPALTESTTYYVESENLYGGEEQPGGKPDDFGGGGLPSTGAYSFFNVYEPFTILTVTVYVPGNGVAGDRTIQLVNSDNEVLDEMIVSLELGESSIELGFEVPVGDGFSLRCPENNLFRNSSGVNYPYSIGDVGEITTSFYGNQYYYYFYNWTIQKESITCVSDRVPAQVVVTGTNEKTAFSSFDIFPNPTDGTVFIELETEKSVNALIQVFDALGRQVMVQDFDILNGQNNSKLDLSEFSNGVYQIQLIDKAAVGTSLATRRIVLNK